MPRVPDTTTFSLQDVINVVGGSSLTEAFANARDWGFDPAYKGDKTNLYNFRNYNHPALKFVGLTLTNTPCHVYDDGTVRKLNVGGIMETGTREAAYSSTQKCMMGIANGDANRLRAVDMTSEAGSAYYEDFSYNIASVIFDTVAKNWLVTQHGWTNASQRGDIPPSSVTSGWTNFMSSVPTSGHIWYATYGAIGGLNGWYYSTGNGETGKVTTYGGPGTELMDSSTHEYYFISLLNAYVAGIGKERDRNRYAWTGNDTSWTTFVIGNSGGAHQIVRYGTQYTIISMELSSGNRTCYYFNHASPSTTPQGIGTSDDMDDDMCVNGGDLYCLTRATSGSTVSKVWKKTSIGGSWVYQFTTSERLNRLWMY